METLSQKDIQPGGVNSHLFISSLMIAGGSWEQELPDSEFSFFSIKIFI